MNFWVIIIMIFCHIVDDYYLQGILAKMKQKDFWSGNLNSLYRKDYIVALIIHAFSWSFMIMLPLLTTFSFKFNWFVFIVFFINLGVHAFVDDLKANKKKINLVIDQTIHIVQIIITAIIVPLLYLI